MLLPWQRFDPRRLPVLLRHAGAWYFASATMLRTRSLLADGNGRRRVHGCECGARRRRGALDQAPGRRASQTQTPSLSGNLATQLVWKELFRERGWLWKIVAATCLVNLIGIATSLFAMQVYDRVVPTMAYATLTTLVAGMAIVVVLDWTFKTIRARILDSLSGAVDQRVSQHVFEHLLHVQLDAQPRTLGTLAAQVAASKPCASSFPPPSYLRWWICRSR